MSSALPVDPTSQSAGTASRQRGVPTSAREMSGMIPTAPAGGIAYNVRQRCRPCSFFTEA